jgi:hypothetical protein
MLRGFLSFGYPSWKLDMGSASEAVASITDHLANASVLLDFVNYIGKVENVRVTLSSRQGSSR